MLIVIVSFSLFACTNIFDRTTKGLVQAIGKNSVTLSTEKELVSIENIENLEAYQTELANFKKSNRQIVIYYYEQRTRKISTGDDTWYKTITKIVKK
ncbi:MAG: hypothetical protein PHW24_00470 [Candidatus Moranbacteria bacterium]|nr:hypothetical protein [Candidatus Moranbacteria bacterium]